MIFLKQLLKEMEEDKDPSIASIQNEKEWKLTDIDHMMGMKFEREGESTFVLRNPPMKVYKKKKGPFVLEEPIENHMENENEGTTMSPMKPHGIAAFQNSEQIKKYEFPTFLKLIEFFDNYKQD